MCGPHDNTRDPCRPQGSLSLPWRPERDLSLTCLIKKSLKRAETDKYIDKNCSNRKQNVESKVIKDTEKDLQWALELSENLFRENIETVCLENESKPVILWLTTSASLSNWHNPYDIWQERKFRIIRRSPWPSLLQLFSLSLTFFVELMLVDMRDSSFVISLCSDTFL